MSKPRTHIAVIRLSAMGDVAMTVPVLLGLVKQYPDVKITVVSKAFFKPIFSAIPNVDFASVHTHHRHKGLLGLYRLYIDLKSKNITHVADLHNVLRSKIVRTLFALSGKKVAFTDKGRAEKKELTRLEAKQIQPLKTMFQRHVETFQKLGFDIDLNEPVFLQKEAIPLKVTHLVGEKKERWIGIAPFAHHDRKKYPLDLMQQVVEGLASDKTVKILLFGGGLHEKKLLDTMASGLSNVYNLAGNVSFDSELHVISNLDVMLSMDSGNAHLAAMYGIETITLWGATHPFAGFTPFNQPFLNGLISDRTKYPFLPTSVYGNKNVPGYEDAMRTILPGTVIAKVRSALQQ